jgi:hypothetical protein
MRITDLLGLLVVLSARWCDLGAQTLQQTTTQDYPFVQIFADGNVKNVISQPGAASTTSGSLGLRYFGNTYIATALINIAGATDTVVKGYGASILAPSTGRSLNAGLLDIRRRHLWFFDKKCPDTLQEIPHPFICNVGFHFYASASSTRWAYDVDSNGIATAATDVPVWGVGVGVSYSFVNGTVGTNSVAMVLDAGLALRALRGDLYAQDSVRQRLLGDTRRDFAGLELGLGIEYNEIKAGLTYYWMNGNVDGVSHGQVVAGISIQANLNSGKVNQGGPGLPADQGFKGEPAESSAARAPSRH